MQTEIPGNTRRILLNPVVPPCIYILHFAALAKNLHRIGVLTALSSLRYKNIRFVELVGNGTVGAMEFCTKDLGVKARMGACAILR